MTDVDVVIAGGGPTALMLACELRLAGVEPVVLERLPEISQVPKGNGLIGQIVPMLDFRGLLGRLSAGSTAAGPVPRFAFGPLMLDFSKLGVSPLHILAIPQRRLEERLGERLAELGGTVRRGHELTALTQDEDAVTLDVQGPDGGYRLRARYLVGCDGAHSLVRKHPSRRAAAGGPQRPARPDQRRCGRRRHGLARSAAQRHQRAVRDQARPRRRAVHQARRLRRLGRRDRRPRPGRRARRGAAQLARRSPARSRTLTIRVKFRIIRTDRGSHLSRVIGTLVPVDAVDEVWLLNDRGAYWVIRARGTAGGRARAAIASGRRRGGSRPSRGRRAAAASGAG
jgi:FAD binding domain